MTRCEFALWRRSYRRVTTSDYLAGRLRFQIGIRIANASIGKVLWTYCRRGMMEGDATWRGTEAFNCTPRLIKVLVWKWCAQRQPLSRFIYLILIGKSFDDRASWIESMAHLSLVHYRSLPMTCVNLVGNCVCSFHFTCNVVTARETVIFVFNTDVPNPDTSYIHYIAMFQANRSMRTF